MSARRRINFGLRERLVAAVSLVLAGLLAATAAMVVLRSEEALVDVQQTRFAALTRQLAETLAYPVLARSAALLEPGLEAFARTPDLVSVEVRDEEDGILASRDGAAGRPGAASAPGQRVTIRSPVRVGGAAPGDDEGELAIFGVGAEAPRLVGHITAVFSTAATVRIQRRVRRDIIAVFVIGGSVGLVLVLLLASSVVRRARRLAQAAEKVASGDLETQVPEVGRDELAALARDFNAMTRALGDQRRALDTAADQLAEREALSAIGRATAVIAHELKNPLGILLGAAEIAANPERPEAARRKAAGIMIEEVHRLERSLEQLLHYARPNPPQRREIDALQLCRDAAARATHPGGPAAEADVDVEGTAHAIVVDDEQAGQILLNLITNAVQAGAGRIDLWVTGDDQRVRVDVVDDGPGIDPAIRDQLFRPFVTTKQRGAGLGLAGARRMARDNGGDLRLEPGEGGAHFVLTLAPSAEESES